MAAMISGGGECQYQTQSPQLDRAAIPAGNEGFVSIISAAWSVLRMLGPGGAAPPGAALRKLDMVAEGWEVERPFDLAWQEGGLPNNRARWRSLAVASGG